jgi:hypothetical protein
MLMLNETMPKGAEITASRYGIVGFSGNGGKILRFRGRFKDFLGPEIGGQVRDAKTL